MAKTTVADTVIIIDDELQNVLWMADWFDSKGVSVQFAPNVNEALERVNEEIYRALIVDLNIPVLEPLDSAVREMGPVYVKYPGLFVANRARNRGYRDRQVIIYSVHKDPEVSQVARQLGCTYIIKGRPREIKAELESVLSFDPTSDP
jgi:CheY-like chemotaxis protein